MDENVGRAAEDRQQNGESSGPAEREQRRSPDLVLSAVANEHRRAVLDSLNNAADKTLEYETLVDRVADRVGDERTAAASDEHRQRVRIGLHHTHLPKLAEAGIIDYEAGTGGVQLVGGELEQEMLALVESYDASE